jgi:hypothetical protein
MKNFYKLILVMLFGSSAIDLMAQSPKTYNTAGTTAITVPAGVSSISAQVWGSRCWWK